ncbi:NtaA/DmoA family FMN-dependent monooxygenase [Nocardia cyriacigeorgica]|uniref:NtaA/DmoA family FMN-dependent monooxygenase n=1 Tax=Nocardia cyriacigeorgica TaxID=135487 RepID=UPI00189403E0|nr:NtaA/DmoA family FMN-dependent monooxygenase [Nocardia cyriacigeorgica]MBF6087404.1 NtaA/DmoA family FMN-dependent monooxygenase [Nocardia cyriacigeorgica]MBF6092666.1 NtaA/DmoA family FMN-dependent monooxygenase [Nocardia cyriacigeorgica]MBF6397243.1 NtaA/DmoA family FMN-dependent monooxygenase [Nocardia cyriacigeorgica]MBF6403099.1 NtaA/DmoA family FMN-dependent monooxygenase [Nocardia cyriacigeorgica]
MSTQRKQVILGAYLGGVNHHTSWWDPAAGSQIEFSSFEHTARTAERGKFDFFFLAEGLALRERAGKIFDQDIIGRPDTFTVLASLAAVTEHLGLAGTINTTFNEPYELARQFASLDHLSGGRAAWNVVTSFDAFTGQNFRRGGYLDRSQRYARAEETVAAVRALWDSWEAGDIVADRESGRYLARPDAGAFAVHSSQFDIAGRFTVPRSPQGRPVTLQAGVSPQGRDFAAANADAIFSPYGQLPEAADFYRDIKARAVAAGRSADDIKILPSASFVLGDTEAEAIEKYHTIRDEQVTGQTALILLEQIWNRDLSAYDPEGPVPDIDPDPDAPPIIQGKAFVYQDRFATVAKLRAVAEEKKLTLREVVIDQFERGPLVGTPDRIAQQIDDFVQNDGSDGFILGSHLVPTGLDEFVDRVVPLLQERGALRAEYTGTTLRDNLGLPNLYTTDKVPARS